MAQIQWNSPAGGFFDSILNWLGGVLPGAQDTAILGAESTPYTVVSQAGVLGLALGGTQSVGAIQTAANATLQVLGGIDLLGLTGGTTNFNAADGTGGGANLGQIQVQNAIYTVPILGTLLGGSANLEVGGVFDNVGSIALDALAPVSGLSDADQIASLTANGSVVLMGGGLITLSNEALNLITGTAGALLTNVDNTIEGAGSITGLQLINQVGGVIDASESLPLIISAYGTTVNEGLLEATHGGKLRLSGNINNLGGTILADGGRVILGGVIITGGALTAGLSGGFVVLQGTDALLDGGLDGINVLGPISIFTNAELTIEGAFNNFGKLLIKTGRRQSNTELLIGAPGAILSGGGEIFLSAATSVITGVVAAATLTNLDNMIDGSGLLGDGFLTLFNGVNGTIMGAGPAGLVIATGINQIENAGLIEAIKGGQVLIQSIIDNTGSLESNGGALTVLDAVTGSGQGIVNGGTLSFGSSFAQNVAFDGPGRLKLAHSQTYTGEVSGFSKTGSNSFDLEDIRFVGASEATYSGTKSGGVLTVTDGTHTASIAMHGDYLDTSFVARSDGHGGTIVTDQAVFSSIQRFAQASATLVARSSGTLGASYDVHRDVGLSLAQPAVAAA